MGGECTTAFWRLRGTDCGPPLVFVGRALYARGMRWTDDAREWLSAPWQELPAGQRTVRWWVDLARHCVAELRHDRASQMAAALTYHTLFSLLPTLVLTLVVLGTFVGEAEREEFKETAVNWVLRPIKAPGNATPDPALENANKREFEEVRRSLTDRVGSTIDELEKVNLRSIGVVGILIFIYGVTGLLTTIERSFNIIYGAADARSSYIRLPAYYTVITLGPIFILAGQVIQRRVVGALATESWLDWAVGLLGAVSPVLTTWLFLNIMYTLLPNTHVSKRMASVGSFVAALLWLAALQLFTVYVQRAAVTTLYGALGLLPLTLFWVWLTWCIVLFGLELSYALQAMRDGLLKHRFGREGEQIVVDRTVLLPMATLVARRFAEGRLASGEDLSRTASLPVRAIRRMMLPLQDAGLIYKVKTRRGRGYTLARPAHEIGAAQVLAATKALVPPQTRGEGPAWLAVQNLEKRMVDELGDRTLADLLVAQDSEATDGPNGEDRTDD